MEHTKGLEDTTELAELPDVPVSDEERLATHFKSHHHEVQEMLKHPDSAAEHLIASKGLHHILDKKGFGHINPLKSVPDNDLQDPEGYQNAMDYADHLKNHNDDMNTAADNVFGSEDVLKSLPSNEEKTKLDDRLKELQIKPEDLTNVGGQLGHYLPDHHTALAGAASNAVNLLNAARPLDKKHGILDPSVQPDNMTQHKYDQMLTIAQQPMAPVHYLKKGMLTQDHINTMQALYPQMHQAMKQKLYDKMVEHTANESKIPYHVRLGLSKFLGMPLDSTLMPQVIAAAQPMPKPVAQPAPNKTKKGTSKLGKSNNSMFTPVQAQEAASGLDALK